MAIRGDLPHYRMILVDAIRQALSGMQQIEREIIRQVRARGVSISAASFSWNRGGSLAELPDPVHMEVRVGSRHTSRHTSTDWLQVCLQDSWERIDRSDVRAEIERIVEALASQP